MNANIGGLSAMVAYAGGAPTLVAGVLQVNVQVPSGIASSGSVPVLLTVGGQIGPPVTIAVASQ